MTHVEPPATRLKPETTAPRTREKTAIDPSSVTSAARAGTPLLSPETASWLHAATPAINTAVKALIFR